MNSPNDQMSAILSLLFATFPRPPGAEGADGLAAAIRAYELALGGYAMHDIAEGVRRLVAGEIAEHDGRYCPTAPQLARAVKAAATERVGAEKRHSDAVLQITSRDQDEQFQASKSAESRARVKAKVAEFAGKAAETMRTEDAKRQPPKPMSERVRAMFDPDMEPEAVRSRLGFTVGNDDGEY